MEGRSCTERDTAAAAAMWDAREEVVEDWGRGIDRSGKGAAKVICSFVRKKERRRTWLRESWFVPFFISI